jgi:hypothetical protein
MLAHRPATLVPPADVPALGRALQQSLAALQGTSRPSRPRLHYDLSAYDRGRAVQQVQSFYDELLLRRSGAAMPALHPQAALHV